MWRDPCECEEDIKREKEGRGETRRELKVTVTFRMPFLL